AGFVAWGTSVAPSGLSVKTGSEALQAPRVQMSEQVFKNVQVLKGIPVDEFMGTMGLFSAALSVCCAECHTGAGTSNPKWEDDPPRKRTARRMIQMVAAINRDNFNGRQVVTCWTCHRGSQRPLVTPALDKMYGEPQVDPPDILPTATSGEPSVDEIFAKYVQALGGAARLASLTSYVARGTSTPFGDVGKGYPAEIYAKAPNQLATIVHQQEGDMARTFDGREGYFLLPLTVVEEYPWTGGALEGAKLDAELAFPGGIKATLENWRVSFSTTINGAEVRVVQGTGRSGLVASFYFDKETGLLLRMVRYTSSALGRVPTQLDFSDYRPVAGVMMPFKWSYSWLSGKDDFVLADVQPNISIDPARFGRPVPNARSVR
ncbi:MAG TPA: photosynthetic reaction center cytochrome c subunit family protein, partial [Vicinamibacterales bacterium]|nr:photosynthetic reaction center cytochrome c subunit family protein [Vicinamibacterales bacterium]